MDAMSIEEFELTIHMYNDRVKQQEAMNQTKGF
jgi:hypothetical protein